MSILNVERLIIPGAGVQLVADAVGAANAARTLLFLHGSGQTILREVLLAGQHTSYHLGQLVSLKKELGAWKEE